MTCAVVQPLHGGTNEPEQSNGGRKPDGQRAESVGDFNGEPPGQRGEDRQRDGNENHMNAEDFPNKKRRAIEIGFPFHDANQKQIQNCDGELRESSGAQGSFERGEIEE